MRALLCLCLALAAALPAPVTFPPPPPGFPPLIDDVTGALVPGVPRVYINTVTTRSQCDQGTVQSQRTFCEIYATTTDLPLVGFSIQSEAFDGEVVNIGTTPKFLNGVQDLCAQGTFASLPGVVGTSLFPGAASLLFSAMSNGTVSGWAANGVFGTVTVRPNPSPSCTAPGGGPCPSPQASVANGSLRLMSILLSGPAGGTAGNGAQTIRGTVIARAVSGVSYPGTFCCGCVENTNQAKACDVPVDINAVVCSQAEKKRLGPCNSISNQPSYIPWNMPSTVSNGVSPIYLFPLDLSYYAGLQFQIIAGDTSFNTGSTTPALQLTQDGIVDSTDRASVGFSVTGLRTGVWDVDLWSWEANQVSMGNVNVYWGPYSGSNTALGPIRNTFTPSPTAPGSVAVSVTSASQPYFVQLKVVDGCVNGPPSQFNQRGCQARLNGFRLRLRDTTAPTLTCVDQTQYVQGPAGGDCSVLATWASPTAVTDNCPLPNVVLPTQVPVAGGITLPVYSQLRPDNGVQPITYAVTDVAGNTATCSFSLTVADINPPAFNPCPASQTVDAAPGACAATVSWPSPSTSVYGCPSNIVYREGAVTVTRGGSFGVGVHNIVATATDNVGRTATCSFSVTVRDVTVPVLLCRPRNVELRCGPAYQDWLTHGGFPSVQEACPPTWGFTESVPFCGSDHASRPAPPVYTSARFSITDGTPNTNLLDLGTATFKTADGSCTCDYRLTVTTTSSCTIGSTSVTVTATVSQFAGHSAPIAPYTFIWRNGVTGVIVATTTSATASATRTLAGGVNYDVTVYDSFQKVGWACVTTRCPATAP